MCRTERPRGAPVSTDDAEWELDPRSGETGVVSGAGAVGMGAGAGAGGGNGPRDGFVEGSFFPRMSSTDAKCSANNSVGGDAAAFTGALFGSESFVGQVSGGSGGCGGGDGDGGFAGVTVNPSASQSKQSGPGIDVMDEEEDGSIDGILGGVSPGGLVCPPPVSSTAAAAAAAAPGDGSGHSAPIWNDNPVWDSFGGVSLGESPVDLASQRSAFAFALGGGGGGNGGGDFGGGRGRWSSSGGDSGCENTETTPQ